MKNIKTISAFTLLIVPVILLGYQNCANFENTSLSKEMNPPILFTSLVNLGFSENTNCEELSEGQIVMFNESRHICALATTSCQSISLSSENFKFDSDGACDDSVDYNSPELIDSFSTSTAKEEGYIPDPNMMCTFQIQTMVNLKTRTCVEARNGCEAGYLKTNEGFTTDIASFCQ